MSDHLLEKATFAEVYRFLQKGQHEDIHKCFQALFGTALLLFPGLMCQDVAAITNLATGATLAGAGVSAIVGDAVKAALRPFRGRKYPDYRSRCEHMQLSQILLVYAAYFDAITDLLPNENDEIILKPEWKRKISENAMQTYIEKLRQHAEERARMPELLECDLYLPVQTKSFSQYKTQLKEYYAILNLELSRFYEMTAVWVIPEGVDETERNLILEQRDWFHEALRRVPERAVDIYEQQYIALRTDFPEFSIWANQQEQNRQEAQIDVGFQEVASRLDRIENALCVGISRGADLLERYRKKYKAYIDSPVFKYGGGEPKEDIVFPAKRKIFIPQAFQAITYQRSVRLELEKTWEEACQGEDIGEHISHVLRHPKYGGLPLLILGLPGAGKTLLCHMLAAQILSAEYHIVIIRLRETPAGGSIASQIEAQLRRDLDINCKWDTLRRELQDKPILLVFDGYDELLQASGKTYANYLMDIADFQRRELELYNIVVRCIVTSRTALIDKAEIPDESHILRLCDFDSRRRELWRDIWNQANAEYFKNHGLKEFSIPADGRLRELAGQPLLLIMLALYEMNGGHLLERENVSRAELYYHLILDFVVRERRKDRDFLKMPEERRQAAVRRDFWNLGVAALGMYNRRQLFIKAGELNQDLAFLGQVDMPPDSMDERALEAADKLVGSFFFIHSAEAVTRQGGAGVRISAYEFLHNTFGEFLTAYYIVDTALRLVSAWLRAEEDPYGAFGWSEDLRRKWYAALAYAPLFTRPVVTGMVFELFPMLFQGDQADMRRALSALFRGEVRRLISGGAYTDLDKVLREQGNPYPHPELMLHAANYSVNLVLLLAVACAEDGIVFEETLGSRRDWEKLTKIWRYAFSEEELLNLSYLLVTECADTVHSLYYRHGEEYIRRAVYLSKLEQLRSIAFMFGEDISYTIFSAFERGTSEHTRKVLEKEDLPIKTKFALNDLLHVLTSPNAKAEKVLYATLANLCSCCVEECDPLGFYIYCAVTRILAAQNLLFSGTLGRLLDRKIFKKMICTIDNYGNHYDRILFVGITQEILGCTAFLTRRSAFELMGDFCDAFVNMFRNDLADTAYNSHILSQFCENLEVLLKNCQRPAYKPYSGNCNKMFRSLRNAGGFFNTWQTLTPVLRVCVQLNRLGEEWESKEIFGLFFCGRNTESIEKMPLPKLGPDPGMTAAVLEYCYYLVCTSSQDRLERHHVKDLLTESLILMDSVEILLPEHSETLYHLLRMLCDKRLDHQPVKEKILSGLLRITAGEHAGALPVRVLRQMWVYGDMTGCEKLCRAVRGLCQVNR